MTTNSVRGLILAAGMIAVVALGGGPARADKAAPKGEVVKTVTAVDVKLEVTEPPILIVTATGQVPTGGWTKAKLTRRATTEPPADGVYEYDLTAVPPDGAAAQVVSKVTAKNEWKDPPKGVKGIKVYGVGDGVKTLKLDGKKDK